MTPISKFGTVVFSSFLFCIGLSTAAQAGQPGSPSGEPNAAQSDRRQGGAEPGEKQVVGKNEPLKGGQTIKGEVVRIDGDKYVVKTEGGKELSLQVSQATQMSETTLKPGHLIEARVDNQNRVLSISSADRRNDHTVESGNAVTR